MGEAVTSRRKQKLVLVDFEDHEDGGRTYVYATEGGHHPIAEAARDLLRIEELGNIPFRQRVFTAWLLLRAKIALSYVPAPAR